MKILILSFVLKRTTQVPQGMKLITLIYFFFICCVSNAQISSINTKPAKVESDQKEQIIVDSTEISHNIKIYKSSNPKSNYKSNIEEYFGKKIKFYDLVESYDHKGYINFENEPQIIGVDTVWLKRKKRVRPSHYVVDTMVSKKYKGEFFERKYINTCSELSRIASEKVKIKINHEESYIEEYTYSMSNRIAYTGFATPVQVINGNIFTIVGAVETDNDELHIKLKDFEGKEFKWIIDNDIANTKKEEWNAKYSLPVISLDYLKAVKERYLGKEFYYEGHKDGEESKYSKEKIISYSENNKKITILKGSKLTFVKMHNVDIQGLYSVPCFLVDNGSEYINLPICRSPGISSLLYTSEPKTESNEKFAYLEDMILISAEHKQAELKRKQAELERKIAEMGGYDSTKNWLGNENVETYYGQTLYVLGKMSKEYGYDDFYTSPEYLNRDKRYGNPSEKSEYKTKYEDLYGKYFIVKQIIKDEKSYFSDYYWLYLEEKDNSNNKVYFRYSTEYEHSWPFIVVSHYNYLKEKYIGKKFVTNSFEANDLITQKPINYYFGEVWECYDISIIDEYKFVLLYKNSKGNKTYSYLEDIDDSRFIYPQATFNKYLKKFGVTNMKIIMKGEITIGMTTEMLLLSWGEPDDINYASYGDQWVYGTQYVYIENGKITAWN